MLIWEVPVPEEPESTSCNAVVPSIAPRVRHSLCWAPEPSLRAPPDAVTPPEAVSLQEPAWSAVAPTPTTFSF